MKTEKPKEQAIEVLNRQIQERDNRIKELEKERDELAINFAEWFNNEQIYYYTDINYYDMLNEYIKQLTK